MKGFLTSIIFPAAALSAAASSPSEVRFHNEESDTLRINEILISAKAENGNAKPEVLISYIGKQLLGTPYEASTLEGSPERITVNMDGMDCTTFVENVAAMAFTVGEGRTSWRDFLYNLERMRYRGGKLNGYASRLHYVSDWIIDNAHRGIIKEVTSNFPGVQYAIKTIDFMSAHRDQYPALADSAEYERMRSAEIGYRNHRFPYIKSSKCSSKDVIKAMRDGDIVAITTKTPGLDVQHLGIIVMKDGIPHLMHASSAKKSVVIDSVPLSEYMRKNRSASGIRVIRLVD